MRIYEYGYCICDCLGYAYPSSSLRCSRKRPSLLSLACASGRLSFAVGERYHCCVYFLSAISFHVRTYADASFHITIQARSTNTRFTYVQSSTCLSLPWLRGFGLGIKLGACRPIVWTAGARMNLERSSVQIVHLGSSGPFLSTSFNLVPSGGSC